MPFFFDLGQILHDMLESLRRGTLIFLGLLCFLAFVANAVLLVWLLSKKGGQGLARCPRCGRRIICPHCAEDERDG